MNKKIKNGILFLFMLIFTALSLAVAGCHAQMNEGGNGGAITMRTEHHRKTASWDNVDGSKDYRQKQKELVDSGRFAEAFEMDVKDIKDTGLDKLLHFMYNAKWAYVTSPVISKALGAMKELVNDEINSWFGDDEGWDKLDMKANREGIEFGKKTRGTMRKIVLGIITFFLIPAVAFLVTGAMQGFWFDAEELLERPDIEVYVDGVMRNYFSIHGGHEPGSAGCIDLTDNDDDFFKRIEQYRGDCAKIKLTVKY